MKVFKFGGASVKDAAAIRNVAQILQAYKEEKISIVVSAMGKSTNAFEGLLNAYFNKKGNASELLQEIKQSHYAIMNELFPENHPVFDEVNDTFVEVEWVIEDEPEESYDYLYDQIVSIGEFVSSKILAAFLNEENLTTEWLDIRDVILTDNTYREAKVEWTQTEKNAQEVIIPKLEKGFILTQGFIGGTSENFTTTLGREGSDFTAAILSYCLNAESMSIWKDVPGILTADPRIFKNVSKIDRLSYREAIEMTYYGAKVIHPKTIKPIQNRNIPLFVKSFINPQEDGTKISEHGQEFYPPVIVIEKDQVLLHISTRNFSFVAEENLSFLFSLFAKHRIKVNMMQNTAISFSVCVNNVPKRIKTLLADLEADFDVSTNENLELVTIRHYRKEVIQSLQKGKLIILEERIRNTAQMVLKDIPNIERID